MSSKSIEHEILEVQKSYLEEFNGLGLLVISTVCQFMQLVMASFLIYNSDLAQE